MMGRAASGWTTDLGNLGDDGRIKELSASRDLPFLVLGWKVCTGEMAKYAGHGHGAIAPWRAKCKVKVEILDIVIARHVTLRANETRTRKGRLWWSPTVWT